MTRKRMTQEVDVSASGISFIDILFALVVTVILDPVQSWARHPKANHLGAGTTTYLVIALVLLLTSWIGYHNSANRPQFKIKFFNYELIKFALDICMVIVYFLVASVATRRSVGNREEIVLIGVAFLLYLFWDIAGYVQKKPGNQYETAWELERTFTPEIGQWKPRKISRIYVTAGCLGGISVLALLAYVANSESFIESTLVNCGALAILIGYRFAKDHVGAT